MSEVKRRKLTPGDDGDGGVAKQKKTFRQLLLDKYENDSRSSIHQSIYLSTPAIDVALGIFLNEPVDEDPEFANQVFEALNESDEIMKFSLTLGEPFLYEGFGEEVEGIQVTFPYLTRFLDRPPKNLKSLTLDVLNHHVFYCFPEHISSKDQILEYLEIDWSAASNAQSEAHEDKLETILYRCCFVKKLKLMNFHTDSYLEPQAYESECEELILYECWIWEDRPVLLHPKTTFKKLRSLEYYDNHSSQKEFNDPVQFWRQWFSRASQTLEKITLEDGRRDESNLFSAMCIEASDWRWPLVRLEELSLALNNTIPFLNFEFLRRSPARLSLKTMNITGKISTMDISLGNILSSFEFLAHLRMKKSKIIDLSSDARDEDDDERCENFLENYFSEQRSLKTLVLSGVKPSAKTVKALTHQPLEHLEITYFNFKLRRHVESHFLSEASLPTSPFPLEKFNVHHYCSIDCMDLVAAVRSYKDLHTLKVRNVKYNAKGVQMILEALLAHPNIFSFGISRFSIPKNDDEGAETRSVQRRLNTAVEPIMQQIRTHCFLNRYKHSVKQSQKAIPSGFLPHVVQQCSKTVGPSGLFVFLKKRLLEDLGLH